MEQINSRAVGMVRKNLVNPQSVQMDGHTQKICREKMSSARIVGKKEFSDLFSLNPFLIPNPCSTLPQ